MVQKRDIVLYFSGGNMTGVFGAGVATAFQKHAMYPRIKAVYGASAGTLNAAYFLTQRSEFGSAIYWESLGKKFIKEADFFIGTWQRFESEFIKRVSPRDLHDAIDIPYLMKVIRKEKPLMVRELIRQPIPLFTKLFEVDSSRIKYFNLKKIRVPKIWDVLRASVSMFPYVHKVVRVGNLSYIDAAPLEIIGFDYLRKRHPKEKIVIILDRPKTGFKYKAKNIVEGEFASWMLNDPKIYSLFANAENRLQADLLAIARDPNAILIAPDTDIVKSRTIDSSVLKAGHAQGMKEAEKALSRF